MNGSCILELEAVLNPVRSTGYSTIWDEGDDTCTS
jgi:hypothetical protein